MRSSPSATLRFVWALLALVQLSATVLAPVADAALGGHGERVAHVESESGDDCGVHHDHLFCQMCRTLASAERPVVPSGLARGPSPTLEPTTAAPSALPPISAARYAPLGSRAPPRA